MKKSNNIGPEESDQNQIFTKNLIEFHKKIEYLKATGLNTIEAVGAYCEEHDIEPDEILGLINQTMMSDIRSEAIKLRLVRDQAPSIRDLYDQVDNSSCV